MKALSIAVFVAALALTVSHAAAADCRTTDPARERAALATFLKQNGYTQKQIAFSLRYADSKAKAWRKFPLTQRGEQCGVQRIGGMVYGCVPGFLTELLAHRPDLNKNVPLKEFIAAKIGVNRLTLGETYAVSATSFCQAEAIRAFADPKIW